MKKWIHTATDVNQFTDNVHTSGCSFDFDLGDNYNPRYLEDKLAGILDAMDIELLGTDFRSVAYPGGKVYSQCGFDFKWKDYYNESEIEEDIANMIDNEGGNFFGIDFYSLED